MSQKGVMIYRRLWWRLWWLTSNNEALQVPLVWLVLVGGEYFV